MCLTRPKQIKMVTDKNIELEDCQGKKSFARTLDKNLKVGDWVLTQADLIIEKITKHEANEINELFRQAK